MKSSIKWAVVVIITPNLVSILKIIVLFLCAKKISKIYCSHCFSIVFYCFPLFVNNRTMGFSKNTQRNPDNGIFIIFLEFNHQNKYSHQIYVHTFVVTETISICCFSLFWSKMTSF